MDDSISRWWHEVDQDGRIQCDLCPRGCTLAPSDRGFCFVRQNTEGRMDLTTYGRSTGFCVDPIEKKPLNHFFPGTAVLSFGTAGCNLGCKFCQNWDSSKSRAVDRASQIADPETIAQAAVQLGCQSVAFTYNDPIIWAEYAIDAARACHERGVKTVAVTAGYISPTARPAFFDQMDAANVDLKAFSEAFYSTMTGSHLQPVLDTLVWLRRNTNVWLEITNLLIPQANDSPDEMRQMCDWLLEHLGDEVPIHFSAFHPDYRLNDRPATPPETLIAAHEIAKRQGLRHVYVGNVHDPQRDSTYCPSCSVRLIERNWYELSAYRLRGNRCPDCDTLIAGCFDLGDRNVVQTQWGRRRLPIEIADYARTDTSHDSAVDEVDSRDASIADRRNHETEEQSAQSFSDAENHGEKAMPRESKRNAVGGQAQTSKLASKLASKLDLVESQEQAIHRVACEIVFASLVGRAPNVADLANVDVSDCSVMGAFVTLKRHGHLRACCGTLGQPMALGDALQNAAFRTATDDTRLPPISLSELPFLTVDVSLLHDFQPIRSSGDARRNEVVIGRHGLTIRRGSAAGLLLPSVPVERGWNAESFLRQVCRKAGVPSTAWQDDSAELETFEACVVEGLFDPDLISRELLETVRRFSSDDLLAMADHCRVNVMALLERATPNYYLAGCDDATVQGVALAVEIPSIALTAPFTRVSMRPGLPLQATLFQLSEAAAGWLTEQRLSIETLTEVKVAVGVFYDSAMHGTVADPDLKGIDTPRHAVMIIEQDRNAWRFDPAKTADQLVQSIGHDIQILNPETAGIVSFSIDASSAALSGSSSPPTQAGPKNRPPAVAGTFYPGEGGELSELVEELLDESRSSAEQARPEPWPAVVVPHAGLRYSGRVAAAVFQQVVIPKRVIIIAPKHGPHGAPWAVAPHDRWELPGGSVASDASFAAQLADAIEGLELDAVAHRNEHAIEIELPILARLAPQAQVVGITVGGGDLQRCRGFAKQLAAVMRADSDRPLLVASTDMNHFAEESENRRLDQLVIDALHQLDPDLLYETVREHHISMCGLLPTVIVMQTLQYLGGLNSCRQVAYTTSAEVSGDTSRVVGYLGMLLS